jgi:hypothetical protein
MNKHILFLLVILNCGCLTNLFEPIDDTYYISSTEDNIEVVNLIAFGTKVFEQDIGSCTHKVYIVTRKWGFESMGQLAAGSCYGQVVNIGINPTSECETIKVLWHELLHSCMQINDNNDPKMYDIEILRQKFEKEGKCIVNNNGLYSNYTWE